MIIAPNLSTQDGDPIDEQSIMSAVYVLLEPADLTTTHDVFTVPVNFIAEYT